MEGIEAIRKVQQRQGSLVLTIPKRLARDLGIGPNQYVRIAADGDRLVVTPVPADGKTGHNAGHGQAADSGPPEDPVPGSRADSALEGLRM